ncbi:ATP-binding protein [Streptomyces bobili]|uniref:ATP-binding protein n=1 Tax=Streptomyces bobili TaxID=67280 RepID=UPI0036F854F2
MNAGHGLHATAPVREGIALLPANAGTVRAESTVSWTFPAGPTVVALAREESTSRLSAWGRDDIAFTTGIVVGEPVTNALRNAGGPVVVRLIRENVLICEVTDPSNTRPGLRRPMPTPLRLTIVQCGAWRAPPTANSG